MVPNTLSYVILFIPALVFDIWWFMGFYIFCMVFSVITVVLGKLFPETTVIPLTSFYKKYASSAIFYRYCGNPFSAISGSAVKVLGSGSGKIFITTGAVLLGQDASHKSGVGQYPKHAFEKAVNNGVHPSNEPFTFKPKGPSWMDNFSKVGYKNKK